MRIVTLAELNRASFNDTGRSGLTVICHRIAPAPAPGARTGRFVAVRHFRDLKTVLWASMWLRLHPGQLTASARGIVIGTDIDRAQIYIEP
jgi:hypothetical protein